MCIRDRYYDAIYILFHTGLRISEFCGLTVSEIEFDEMRIKVDHQLQRTSQMKYVIEEPKTESGTRLSLIHIYTEERAQIITEYGKDVIELEKRLSELAAPDAGGPEKYSKRHAAAPER